MLITQVTDTLFYGQSWEAIPKSDTTKRTDNLLVRTDTMVGYEKAIFCLHYR